MNEIIHVRNLTKSYGKIKALDNVSFDIPEGVAALIGPNGSGKTTFINIISARAGLSMELHEDSVVLKNVDPDDLTKVLRLAGNSGLTIRYVEPEKNIIEAIYLSILREEREKQDN